MFSVRPHAAANDQVIRTLLTVRNFRCLNSGHATIMKRKGSFGNLLYVFISIEI